MRGSPNRIVDAVDIQMINHFQENSRLSIKHLASDLKISRGTIRNRIKRLENKGILKCFTIIVDPAKIGYDLTAVILIDAEGKHLLEVEKEIAILNNVISVYNITGDYNISLTVRLSDREALGYFIKSLIDMPFVKKIVTNIALNIIKEDFRIKIPELRN